MSKASNLVDIVANHLDQFNVRPEILSNLAFEVRQAVIELQKTNLLPESIITFTSLELKDEERDLTGALIYNYYRLPSDFRQLYTDGPAFQVYLAAGSEPVPYRLVSYPKFLNMLKNTTTDTNEASETNIFCIKRETDEDGEVHRLLLARPFPSDDDQVSVTYFSNGVDIPIESVTEEFWRPVIEQVKWQLGLSKTPFEKDRVISDTKRNRMKVSQNNYHNSFTRTKPRFFGK